MRSATNYRVRLKLLRSGLPRLVIRKTNSSVITQIIISEYESNRVKDITMFHAYGRELYSFGWPFSYKNVMAAYLTGYLIAKKASNLKSEIIVDKGLYTLHPNSFVFFVIKGAIDGGLKVRAGEINISNERLLGLHIKHISELSKGNQFRKVKDKINDISKIFQDVKNRIDEKYGK
ncbi:MAG: hypothetical protein QXP36_04145 [Conexivisphaerales archaeon]